MTTPHVHSELIKAWADGAEIQANHFNEWVNELFPTWETSRQYRIKPKPVTVRYRVALFKDDEEAWTGSAQDDAQAAKWATDRFFDRWLTDWQEVEA